MKFSHTVFCAWILMISSSASAGPSAHRTQEGSGLLNSLFGTHHTDQDQDVPKPRKTAPASTSRTTSKQVESSAYDDIWKDSDGKILLIKQIHRTLYISGSSKHASWQAQCIMAVDSARCIGNGISNTAGEFRYESSLHLDNVSLQSSWTRNYSNGQTQSGQSSFNFTQ